jgi:competence protein ComEC
MNTIHTKTIVVVVGVLLGIVVGEKSVLSTEVGIIALMLAMVQSGLYIFERKRNTVSEVVDLAHRISFPLITLLFSFGLFIGIVRAQLVEEKNNFVCESGCIFEGVVVTSPETKNEYQTFSVQPLVNGGEVHDVLVRVPLYPRYQIGETIKLSGKVTVPKIIYSHDGDRGERSFDYASYLRTKNIGSEIMYPHVEVIDADAHTLRDVLGRLKENYILRIEKYVSSPSSSLASGMLFGASSMSKELMQTFRIAGLSHIVVLSGFNIVIVISAILFLFGFLPLFLRIFLASVSVLLFVVMVGGEASVLRATLMAFISLLALSVGRLYVARQALIVSLLLIVLFDPYTLLHDVSLHLSFLATAGLVYMTLPLEKIITSFINDRFLTLKEIVVTTLSAYVGTLPYVMYTFGTMSVYAIIANILVVPFVPLAMLFSFLVVVSSYFSDTLSLSIGFINTQLINMMIGVARIVESLPYSSVTFGITFQWMCFMYLFIIFIGTYGALMFDDETVATEVNGIISDTIRY